jgi:thiol-disulfide isomerase/thioredoxin
MHEHEWVGINGRTYVQPGLTLSQSDRWRAIISSYLLLASLIVLCGDSLIVFDFGVKSDSCGNCDVSMPMFVPVSDNHFTAC